MFPRRLQQNSRVIGLTLLITFISGANFFSVLMFWPTQAFNVYGHNPIGVGVRGIPIGFSIMGGACIVLVLLSVTRGKIRMLMVGSTVSLTGRLRLLALVSPLYHSIIIGYEERVSDQGALFLPFYA
jgi:hypothetical protein